MANATTSRAAREGTNDHGALLGEAFHSWAKELREGGAQKALRRRAAEVYAASALPSRARHLWRYTDPASLLPGSLRYTPELMPELGPEATSLATPEGGALVRLAPGHAPSIQISSSAQGLEILPLTDDAPGSDQDATIGAAVPPEHGLFEALNAAAWTGGVQVRLARGVALQGPVHVVLDAGADAHPSFPRVLVVAEPNSELLLIEEHVGGGEQAGQGQQAAQHSLEISVTELFVGANAQLRHVLLQNWRDGARGHITTRGRISRDGSLKTVVGSLGGALAKLDLGADLMGPGAHSDIRGFCFADGKQQLDHHTRHRHASGQTHSNIDFRQALSGKARAAYTGLIRVDEDAAGAEALQENRNLLLSGDSRVDTIPELEILTDDVSCSHGATVAPLDLEPLFYLQSRSISPEEAVRLIVRGFIDETLEGVPASALVGLEEGLTARLAALDADEVLASAAEVSGAASGAVSGAEPATGAAP